MHQVPGGCQVVEGGSVNDHGEVKSEYVVAYYAGSVYQLHLLEEPVEDLLLVALPLLEDGDGAALLLVGDGDDLVVVGGAWAGAVGLDVEEEAGHAYVFYEG